MQTTANKAKSKRRARTYAQVTFFKGRIHRLRAGRGFSKSEIKEAGFIVSQLKNAGVPVDPKRRTKKIGNVNLLKQLFGSSGAPPSASEAPANYQTHEAA